MPRLTGEQQSLWPAIITTLILLLVAFLLMEYLGFINYINGFGMPTLVERTINGGFNQLNF